MFSVHFTGRLPRDSVVREEVVDQPGGRFFVFGQLITISPVRAEDEGTYFCTVSNSAGTAESSFRVFVFRRTQVVQVEVRDLSDPNVDGTCHAPNQEQFEVSNEGGRGRGWGHLILL